MKRVFWLTLWLLGPTAFFARVMLVAPADNFVVADFANLWGAGRLAIEGNVAVIFDPVAFPIYLTELLGAGFAGNNYSYPPHALFLALPFASFSYWLSLALWTVIGILLFTWAARRWCPIGFPWLLATLTPAGVANIYFGHYGFVYGALWLLAFSSAPIRAGLFAALLTFKPHLGLLVVVQMLRDRRNLIAAALGTGALVLVSAAAFGQTAWTAFFTTTFEFQTGLISEESRHRLFFMQVAPLITYGWPGQIYFALAGAYLLSRNFNVFTAATATFLIIPYGLHYDLTVASLGFAVLLYRHFDEMPAWHRVAMCFGFMAPALVMLGNYLVAPLLLLGLLAQSRYPVEGGFWRQTDRSGCRQGAEVPSGI